MRGRGAHARLVTGELADHGLERLRVALPEHRPGRLAVVGEDDEAIRTGRVSRGLLDQRDDLVQSSEGTERLGALDPGVVRDLVVVDEVDIDRGRAAVHLLDHQGRRKVSEQDVRRGSRERIRKRPRAASPDRRLPTETPPSARRP